MPDAATSQRLREAFEAFFSGDVDTTVAMMDPDVYGVDLPDMPDAGSYRGRQALKERLLGFLELFDDLVLRELRIEDVGERALAVLSLSGRARAGGLPVEFMLVYLLELGDDGLTTEIRVFSTEQDARAYAVSL